MDAMSKYSSTFDEYRILSYNLKHLCYERYSMLFFKNNQIFWYEFNSYNQNINQNMLSRP